MFDRISTILSATVQPLTVNPLPTPKWLTSEYGTGEGDLKPPPGTSALAAGWILMTNVALEWTRTPRRL